MSLGASRLAVSGEDPGAPKGLTHLGRRPCGPSSRRREEESLGGGAARSPPPPARQPACLAARPRRPSSGAQSCDPRAPLRRPAGPPCLCGESGVLGTSRDAGDLGWEMSWRGSGAWIRGWAAGVARGAHPAPQLRGPRHPLLDPSAWDSKSCRQLSVRTQISSPTTPQGSCVRATPRPCRRALTPGALASAPAPSVPGLPSRARLLGLPAAGGLSFAGGAHRERRGLPAPLSTAPPSLLPSRPHQLGTSLPQGW